MKAPRRWFTLKSGSRFKKTVIGSLVASLLLQSVAGAEVIVVNHFPANRGPGYRKPCPDAAGAVGPRHTAVLDDRAFVVHDKVTGKVLRNETQHEFWLKVLPAKTFSLNANDPRLLYDPITQRWFAWVQGLDPQNGYLAVSATSDPTGTWRGVKMPIPPHNWLRPERAVHQRPQWQQRSPQGPNLLCHPDGGRHRRRRAESRGGRRRLRPLHRQLLLRDSLPVRLARDRDPGAEQRL